MYSSLDGAVPQAVLEANLPPLPYPYEVDLLSMCANVLPLSCNRHVSYVCMNMRQVSSGSRYNMYTHLHIYMMQILKEFTSSYMI